MCAAHPAVHTREGDHLGVGDTATTLYSQPCQASIVTSDNRPTYCVPTGTEFSVASEPGGIEVVRGEKNTPSRGAKPLRRFARQTDAEKCTRKHQSPLTTKSQPSEIEECGQSWWPKKLPEQ